MIVWVRLYFKPSGLRCEMTVTPLEWVLGRDFQILLPRRHGLRSQGYCRWARLFTRAWLAAEDGLGLGVERQVDLGRFKKLAFSI